MKLKKIISALIALSMVSAFAVTASAELVADNSSGSVVISTIPTKEEFAARATTVDTTVTQLTEAEAGMPTFDLMDEKFAPVNIFSSAYKVYKISNKVKVGDVASRVDAMYCGVYGITVSYTISDAQKGYIYTDGLGTIAIGATVDGNLMSAKAGISGNSFNMLATSKGTIGSEIYPGAGNYIPNATVTLNAYVVLTADAPAVELPKSESEIVYYAKRGAANVVENAKNTPTMNNASITLGEVAKTKYTVTFMNGDETVQSGAVEEGAVITAPADPVKAGHTFIGWYDGKTKFEAGATASKNVTYTAKFTKDPVSVTKITISGVAETMTVGDTGTATATVEPADADNKTVTWSSSAEDVLAINATTGAYEALKAGTAVITATAADGSSVTATVNVTVNEPVQTITVGTPFKGTENKGFVWRVTVENFKNAGLSYKFTDEDTSEVRENDFNLGALELSNFVFDVIMNTERANVKLEVK